MRQRTKETENERNRERKGQRTKETVNERYRDRKRVKRANNRAKENKIKAKDFNCQNTIFFLKIIKISLVAPF